MSDLKKYMFEDRTFDPDFDPDDENSFEFAEDRRGQEEVAEEEAFYEEPPAPTFSEEEVAAAQQTAFDEGKTAGLQEANAQFEHMMATALTQISATLPQVFQQHVQSQHDHEALALSVARAVGKKNHSGLRGKKWAGGNSGCCQSMSGTFAFRAAHYRQSP